MKKLRRPFAAGFVCCLLAVIAAGSGVSAADRPNVLLIMADDQGWGDTSYNGHPVLKTPHLDDMARVGLRFDRFYAAAPVCSPTRGSVMTGRNPNRFGCFSWGYPLRPQEVTIAERLRAAGYATGHFGKWHLGSVLKDSPVNPGNSGFDTWLSAFNFYDNDPILSREGTAVELKGESSMVAAEAAIEFMSEHVEAGRPFFAVVWFGSPHSPHRAAPEDKALYQGHPNADWLGEITGLDRAVGRLRESLKTMGVHSNTLVWYTSDNGGLKKESTGGREKKGSVYEGGLRVPAIIEWPEQVTQPAVTSVPAVTSDIYPTLLDIIGIQPPAETQPVLDGISLRPLIEGRQFQRPSGIGFWDMKQRGISTPHDKWIREELAAQRAGRPWHDPARLVSDAGRITKIWSLDTDVGHSAWLDWPWKLHRISQRPTKRKPDSSRSAEPRIELYNLADDPMETTNLADRHPDIARRLQQQLVQWRRSVIHSLNGDDYK